MGTSYLLIFVGYPAHCRNATDSGVFSLVSHTYEAKSSDVHNQENWDMERIL
jgi:hypothetical protein